MKTVSIFELREDTARVVQRVMREARKTRRSSRVRLGSITPVLINPTIRDTQNKITLQQNESQSLLKHAKSEIALAYKWTASLSAMFFLSRATVCPHPVFASQAI